MLCCVTVQCNHCLFFSLLNTITFHSRMVDQLEETISDTSDLSIFCFYARLFEDHFQASEIVS